jgi:hypothetical protein
MFERVFFTRRRIHFARRRYNTPFCRQETFFPAIGRS